MKPSRRESSREPGKIAPAPHPAERRIEVRVHHDDDGSRRVVLQDMSWGPGIGWYPQKTIRLDAQQVEALMGALCCIKQMVGKGETSGTAVTLENVAGEDLAGKIVRIADLLGRNEEPGVGPGAKPS